MTLPDVIDEVLKEIGADPKRVEEARHFALAMHCKTAEIKERVSRQLTDDEAEQYKRVILLYFAELLTNPEMREELRKKVEAKVKNN